MAPEMNSEKRGRGTGKGRGPRRVRGQRPGHERGEHGERRPEQRGTRGVRGEHREHPRGYRPFTPAQIEARRAAVPAITYAPDLPVSARADVIKQTIAEHQVVIISGETGSGKTTQIPKMCLDLGRGVEKMIGHTQPRRIAARSVAERISHELGTKLGGAVGYQVRFTDVVSDTTLVKLMTDGILLAEIQSDPLLQRYDTIIIDEAHERSLNIDFLLGYIASILPRRPDLKLIITSATIDSQRFARHFASPNGEMAPIIEVSGRTYPVEIIYFYDDDGEPLYPVSSDDSISHIVDATQMLLEMGGGDVLVFLSGEGEIRELEDAFRDALGGKFVEPGGRSTAPGAVEVLPLFGRLTAAEQQRIFEPSGYPRIILATNIAETSLTVPGIRYVVDPGTARISRFSQKTKVQRLPIEPISQASANQRSGRCGRVADGVAIRMYSRRDFDTRPEFTEPEIQRTSLAAVILKMASLGLGDVVNFPFVDRPDLKAISSGVQMLEEIGALKPNTRPLQLTAIGRTLAGLPIDPRLARMLLAGSEAGCAAEMAVIVAALSVQDVRERPQEMRAEADALHERFTDKHSDFLAYLNLWRYLRTSANDLSSSAFRRLCRTEYLNFLRFREWVDVYTQLREMAQAMNPPLRFRELSLPEGTQAMTPLERAEAAREHTHSHQTPAADDIHRSLLVGLLSNIGAYSATKREYLGARSTQFVIWPGSGLYKSHPAWVMAAELVETSRLYARSVAAIKPEWIEPLAGHLVRRVHSEPFWSSRRGAAMIHEKVLLYGLTIEADRHITLASLATDEARALARELFIRHGIVEGQWRSRHKMFDTNRELREQAEEIAERVRDHSILADDADIEAWYSARIPASVVSARHFDAWWKDARRRQPDLLTMRLDDVINLQGINNDDYPTRWVQDGFDFPVTYSFNPGKYGDGVRVDVPVTVLPALRPEPFTWAVPGLRSELVLATIRALPKRIRRGLMPAPEAAAAIEAALPTWDGGPVPGPGIPSFYEAFAAAARQTRGVEITDADWAEVELPPHLRVTIRVLSERGAILAEGHDCAALAHDLAPATQAAVEKVVHSAVARALEEAGIGVPKGDVKKARSAAPGAMAGAAELPAGTRVTAFPDQIEDSLVLDAGGYRVTAYPALQRRDGAVYLTPLAREEERARYQPAAVAELLMEALRLPDERVTSRWTSREMLALAGSRYESTGALVADIERAAARMIADQWAATPEGKALESLRSGAEFEALKVWARDRFEDAVYQVARWSAAILEAAVDVHRVLTQSRALTLIAVVSEEKQHLELLAGPGFISRTPASVMPHIPRYIKAIGVRLEKAGANVATDEYLAHEYHSAADAVAAAEAEALGKPWDARRAATIERAQWMLEELRVSLFAQALGTSMKVSPQRIRKALQ